jgi:peptide/bleomycin uptake transporter
MVRFLFSRHEPPVTSRTVPLATERPTNRCGQHPSRFRSFYDVLGDASALAGNATTTEADWAAKRFHVSAELIQFVKIAAVAVAVMPIARLLRSLWTLHWRLALTRAYLTAWDTNRPSIEGAAQRVQEDSLRFARGTEMCLTVGLDAAITLTIFTPVLLKLGAETRCPDVVSGYRIFGDGWLVGIAVFVALTGLGFTLLVGHRLVGLEVANQKVEAALRTNLVVLETSPERICKEVQHRAGDTESPVDTDTQFHGPIQTLMSALPSFIPDIANVKENYTNLYLNFTCLNLWVAIFEQFATVLPYLIVAPLLFSADASSRVSMGVLIQLANTFEKVFSSLNVLADNWGSVNEFRSVLVRLRQFEANLYKGVPHPCLTRTRVRQFGVLAEVALTEVESSAAVDVREHL